MTSTHRFKVTKSEKLDRWKVNGGYIATKYYAAVHIMSKAEAQRVADARNRLVMKKAGITRKIRAARKK
jgi:ribosomal protein L35